jgi:enoyl-CoA hydratase/carnithine racemase
LDYTQIKYEVENGVLTITLNRPDKLNAFTDKMCEELLAAYDQAEKDDAVKIIIITGAGKGFCAGMDLGDGGATFDYSKIDPDKHRDTGGLLSLKVYDLKKPIIAAINGAAVGVGITMTLPMDIRIMSNKVKAGFVFARRGIVPEACSGWFLPRIVGIAQAMDWALSGRVFGAEEALKGGLCHQVVAPEDLMPTARAIAKEIVDNCAPVSLTFIRQLMWKMLGADHPMASHKAESRTLHWIGQQPDAAEGVLSFVEKRAPKYSMSPAKDLPDFFYKLFPQR